MNLLRSKEATLSVLVIALIAQIPHAAYVFTHIGKQQETWFSFGHGGAYAIALELAVLLFVVRRRQAMKADGTIEPRKRRRRHDDA